MKRLLFMFPSWMFLNLAPENKAQHYPESSTTRDEHESEVLIRNFARNGLCVLVVLFGSSAGFAYDPGCPYCAAEPAVLTAADPLLNMSMKWCTYSEAASTNNPGLACQSDFKTMLWRRHERATDCIWTPQARISLRSGGAVQKSDYTQFMDLDTAVGLPGDVSVVSPGLQDLIDTWIRCDMDWAAQPKGAIAVNVQNIVRFDGLPFARALAIQGSAVRPWMVVADPSVSCQHNERSLAKVAGQVLGVLPVTTPANNLMVTGGLGANLSLAQIHQAVPIWQRTRFSTHQPGSRPIPIWSTSSSML